MTASMNAGQIVALAGFALLVVGLAVGAVCALLGVNP